MNTGWKIFATSIVVVALLSFLLVPNPPPPPEQVQREDEPQAQQDGLVFYCAAGIQKPVSEVAEEYQKIYGVPVQLQYEGSGTLLSKITVARRGDIYLAADISYINIAKEKGLVAESIPLSHLHPVIAVKKGNPKKISGVADLLREDVRTALANPDAASVGKLTRKLLTKSGEWDQVKAAAKVFKPTVNEVAIDIKIGTVDAGIIWDSTARQYAELETVEIPLFQEAVKTTTVAILKSSGHPQAALRFCRYLGARDRGLKNFKKWGFDPVEGDKWAETPELVLYSGGVNRVAIQETIKEFQRREGVKVTTAYNGCGILTGQIMAGENPDGYFACDVSFMHQVADRFQPSQDVSQTGIVIALQKGNPKDIKNLEDLTAEGLKIGVANDKQSALGSLTRRLLEQMKLYEKITKNVRAQTPTADLLVNQLRTGSLDAVIVYAANCSQVLDSVELIRIEHRAASAVQPIAVSLKTDYPHTMSRLIEAIRSAKSKARFTSAGFDWRVDE
ncbi:MAG: molybdate ABC transporter substrate-binding protein [Planctomycetota bacterium]|jgi:molybdenum ABC transporter molybdate-binding protein|nr:molybdate ABC transporter substrate-binding protein [Planctomycetota bacterium]MDP7130689.1 molybdate ABC transporter substrate-binding protein [Planctomycetota bacterium]MDP7250218.1 molybdate ABC transporter substrate-binding protein [Planctomycetota bacterium]